MRQPVPFGNYLLLDRISVGGMAEVFCAKSFGVEGFEKLLAIKRILPSMADDQEFLRMFVDEAKIAGQLSHPSIAQIYELGREGRSPYIAMEYVWGKDLLQIYNRFRKLGERMPTTMACHVVAKACEGLDYAHRKRDPLGQPLRIVHRDCSPQNILVSYEGEVKIIDFGIAKAASRVSHTNAGVLKGKFAYLSPEQVRGQDVDHRSDLFALGAVFYECLTGERLFHCESDFSTLERVRDAKVPRPREICADIPEQVERIALRALAKNPADRYQHGSEMFRDLQAYLRSQEHPYTASALGAWIRGAFPGEMEREREHLDRYRRVGPGGELRDGARGPAEQGEAEVILSSRPSAPPHARAGFAAPAANSAAADGAAGAAEETEGEDEGEDEAEPTLMGGPDIADLEPEEGERLQSSGRAVGASGDFADEGPTEVHGEIDGDEGDGDAGTTRVTSASTVARGPDGPGSAADATDAMAAAQGDDPSEDEPTETVEDLSDEVEPEGPAAAEAEGGPIPASISQEPTQIKAAPERARTGGRSPSPEAGAAPASGAELGNQRTLPMPSTVGERAREQARAVGKAGGEEVEKEHTASVKLSAVPQLAPASGAKMSRAATLWRDIGIGVALAVGLLAMVYAGHAIFGFGAGEERAGGVVEIDLREIDEGFVTMDGEEVGRAAGARLTLESVAPGEHLIEVVRGGEAICRREVHVTPEARTSLVCAPRASPPAALVLESAEDDHRVLVDGRAIDVDPTSEAIEVEGGTEVDVEVLEGGVVLDRFEVAAAPGELVRRRVGEDDDAAAEDEAEDEAEDGEGGAREASEPAERAEASPPRRDRGSAQRRAGAEQRESAAEGQPAAEAAPTEEEEPEKGYLIARTEPWARVFVDGEDTELMTPIAPRSRLALEPGVREITFVVGDESFTYRVRIEAGETRQIAEKLPVE